jgi:hypothetical protein
MTRTLGAADEVAILAGSGLLNREEPALVGLSEERDEGTNKRTAKLYLNMVERTDKII